MFQSSLPNSFHIDVLSASPSTDEQKIQLISEIKNRAKGSIQQRNFPEAIQLYTKAIEVCPLSDSSGKSILYANRSMCHVSMSNFLSADEDATIAISTDPSYLKAYYRKTVALAGKGDLNGAHQAVLQGLALKPDDKELVAQLRKLETQLASTPTTGAKAPNSADVASNPPKVTTSVKAVSSASVPASPPTTSSDPVDPEDGTETFRGYKKRADGRVTTFFNNDLDDQVKIFSKLLLSDFYSYLRCTRQKF